ncbi:hypothetical protein pb186bvf_004746 [Paramecium bursaria]
MGYDFHQFQPFFNLNVCVSLMLLKIPQISKYITNCQKQSNK